MTPEEEERRAYADGDVKKAQLLRDAMEAGAEKQRLDWCLPQPKRPKNPHEKDAP